MKTIIVDDEPLSREGLARYAEKIAFIEVVAEFESAVKAIAYLANNHVDLILLDIQMPHLTGLDFLKGLKDPPIVIFHTAYPNYALESYQLDVIDYLVKPVLFERFQRAALKANEYYQLKASSGVINSNDYVFVKSEGKLEKVIYDKIYYVEAMQNYSSIFYKDQKIIVLQSLKYFEDILPKHLFMRVHKSFIVALAKIDAIEGNQLIIATKKIPFSRDKKDALYEKLNIR